MPELDRFYREAADKAAILVVAPSDQRGGMRDLIMAGRYSFPVMLDEGDVASAYKVRSVPTLFVIDAQGRSGQDRSWAASISPSSTSSWMTSPVDDLTR